MTTPAWDAARGLLAERFRARERFWREKERGDLSATADTFRIRAEECAACADIAEHLQPSYAAPENPDMAAAKASRAKGDR